MRLTYVDRFNQDSSSYLAVFYTEKDSEFHDPSDDDNDNDSDSDQKKGKHKTKKEDSEIDFSKAYTNVKLIMGKKLDRRTSLDSYIASSDSE